MAIEIKPIWPEFGASMRGLNLSEPLPPETVAQIEAALGQYAVVSFPQQPLNDEQQLAFSGRFGRIHQSVIAPDKRRLKNLYFGDVSNLKSDNEILDPDSERKKFSDANQLWHTDLSFMNPPARCTVLSARRLPANPPPTEFIDMRRVWEDLPEDMKRKLQGLTAEHSLTYSRRRTGYLHFDPEEKDKAPAVVHPLVRTHRASGRTTLYLSSHIGRIMELSQQESDELLAELNAFADQPKFIRAYSWQPDDVLLWDDSCTMHRAVPFDAKGQIRELRWNGIYEPAPLL